MVIYRFDPRTRKFANQFGLTEKDVIGGILEGFGVVLPEGELSKQQLQEYVWEAYLKQVEKGKLKHGQTIRAVVNFPDQKTGIIDICPD